MTARPDDGFTMAETLVALAILGISVVALVRGLDVSLLLSNQGARRATAAAEVTRFGEAVVAAPYTSCATTYSPSGFTVEPGYTAAVESVRYWNPTSRTFTTTCGTDAGLQLVAVRVSAPDGHADERLELVKRRP